MTGVRIIHEREHGLSVRRDGDRFLWTCRCGFEYTHPVGTTVTTEQLLAHTREVTS